MCEGTHLRCVGGEERPSSGRAIILHHDRPTATLGLHLLAVVVVVVLLELPYSTHHTGLADRSSTPVHHSMPSMRHRLGQASRRQRLLLGRHQGCVDKTRLDCLQHLQVWQHVCVVLNGLDFLLHLQWLCTRQCVPSGPAAAGCTPDDSTSTSTSVATTLLTVLKHEACSIFS